MKIEISRFYDDCTAVGYKDRQYKYPARAVVQAFRGGEKYECHSRLGDFAYGAGVFLVCVFVKTEDLFRILSWELRRHLY